MAIKKEKIIPAGEFKQKCLALIDEVAAGEFTIIITKHGKQKVKIIMAVEPESRTVFGAMADTVKVLGDLTDTEEESWEANEDE